MVARTNQRAGPAARIAMSASRPETMAGAAVVTFEDFYRTEQHRILAVVLLLTGDRGVAEDIVQESFAAAYRRWETIRRYDRPGAWVRRVALNRAGSRLRRRSNERRALERLRARPDGASSPRERDETLWAAVRQLPARQAQAIALVYVEDMAVAEVADVLGCSVGSVKQHLSRAKARLAEVLGSEGSGTDA
jgi:RNA polymerase sigma-70 factor (sigma-E family)